MQYPFTFYTSFDDHCCHVMKTSIALITSLFIQQNEIQYMA